MRLLQVFNQYRSLFNGEETVVQRTEELIRRHGGEVRTLVKSSRDLAPGLTGKMYAFASGIYNPWSAAEVLSEVEAHQIDVVHAHNTYPLFSPSIFRALKKNNVPVVLSLHNQQLTCPRADHMRDGKICDTCLTSSALQCGFKNCRDNRLESWAYAIRSQTARKLGLFRDNVTIFIALTQFAKQRLVQSGYDAERISVLPNMAPGPFAAVDPAENHYVAFAGRLSAEKGIPTLLAAARKLPQLAFRLAGAGPEEANFRSMASENVEFVGKLERQAMIDFYRQARLLVLPSNNYEMCPLVISEAMSHGVPVVASRIGGIPELVDHGKSGLLFPVGDVDALAASIERIVESPTLCRELGEAARHRAQLEFGEDRYLEQLLSIYQKAIDRIAPPFSTPSTLKTSTP